MEAHLGRPDFVIVGCPSDRYGFMVIGSDQVSQADMRAILRDTDDDWMYPSYRESRPRQFGFTLTVHCDSYTLAVGATYQEALEALLRAWQPKGQQRRVKALPETQRIIE